MLYHCGEPGNDIRIALQDICWRPSLPAGPALQCSDRDGRNPARFDALLRSGSKYI